LDEIGDMSPVLQSKILRIIQEGTFERLGSNQTQKVNVRIIAATNINLKNAIKNKLFREDLYYRLNTVNIKLPSLKERDNDIVELANYFISKFNKEFKKSITKIPESTIRLLKSYNWPGNVKELENVIKQAVVISHSDILLNEYLNIRQFDREVPILKEKDLSENTSIQNRKKLKELIYNLAESKEENLFEYIESITIETVMQMKNNNQTQSAKVLGINRMTLRNKLKELKLQKDENKNKSDA
jgi:transcriptional regulator with PAS, ATPase and Fis domain